ncbi:MAG TPA: amidohydrolase family protein [Steroidobacteraceae bacterium]|nr:amidohydrolase family protein [Steroidobacteraceae bacterium]
MTRTARIRGAVLAAALAGLLAGAAHAATIIHAGQLIDGVSPRASSNQTVVVDGGKIVAIEPGFRKPGPNDVLIDLSDGTLLPGFMDAHVHLSSEQNRRTALEGYTLNDVDRAIDAVVFAQRTLLAGFTTVRDLGDGSGAVIALARAVNAGKVPGPRIIPAGKPIGSTGGHADPTNGWSRALEPVGDVEDAVVDSPDAARKAVRQRYKEGAQTIKIMASGGVLSLEPHGAAPQMTDAEIRAVVETARDYGFKVAAHAHGAEAIKRAVRGGVDSIEHGTYLDDEAIKLMKERGTFYVPTLSAAKWVHDKAQDPTFFPEVIRPKANEIGAQIQKTFGKAWKAGLKVMFGTDTGVSAHGDNAGEFRLMVEGGMPPMAAIQAATSVPAKFLGIDDRTGSIAVGKLGELVGVHGDPLKDIGVLEHVVFVMKDDKVFKAP